MRKEEGVQPCNIGFNVTGRGSAQNKNDAVKRAREDAQDTAKVICEQTETCKVPKFKRYVDIDVSGGNPDYQAVITAEFECGN